jgi:AcrR family transcriptional regulator
MADAGGVESLSMRKLGQELGVEAMSLYNHVANKNDLLRGIVDLVVHEFELPDADGDWDAALRASAISAHDALLRHPWACALMMSPALVSPARLRYIDALLARIRAAGFSPETTYHAYHALDSHIFGFSIWEASHMANAKEIPDPVAFARSLPLDDYPDLTAHIDQHQTGSARRDEGEFEFGLDLILDSLKRIRAQSSPSQ